MSSPAESRDSRSMGMNMVTTVMAFSVSAFFVLFVFTRLLCARIHLRAAAAEHAAAATHAGDAFSAFHVERGIRGVEPAVVTSFPTVKFGDDSHRPPSQEEPQCTVCLEEYEAKDVVRVLPYCGHAFHAACIDAWLKQRSTCPVCRASLPATAKHRAAAAAAAMPPVYHAALRAPTSTATPLQVSTSSSDRSAVQGEAAASAAATGHMDAVTDSQLEIVSDEPASSSGCPSAAPSPAASEHPCSATARRSTQGNDASEHC